ncbi:MAG: hypothetical protein Q8P46_09600 [Hyphomicrobiales bacterium]|nr:hypothetical protein [Hyphomicrobiales bacterium]
MCQNSNLRQLLFATILMVSMPLAAWGEEESAVSDDFAGSPALETNLVPIDVCGLLSAKEVGEALGGVFESGQGGAGPNPFGYGNGYSRGCAWRDINDQSGNSQNGPPSRLFALNLVFWEAAPPDSHPGAIPPAQQYLDEALGVASGVLPGYVSEGSLKKISGLGDGAVAVLGGSSITQSGANEIHVRSGDVIIIAAFGDALSSEAVQEKLLPIVLSELPNAQNKKYINPCRLVTDEEILEVDGVAQKYEATPHFELYSTDAIEKLLDEVAMARPNDTLDRRVMGDVFESQCADKGVYFDGMPNTEVAKIRMSVTAQREQERGGHTEALDLGDESVVGSDDRVTVRLGRYVLIIERKYADFAMKRLR